MSERELNIRTNARKTIVDEMTLLLYAERQLDREAAQEVSLHTQTCTRCLTLLRALDRESRLLTRSMLEQDEPLPARLAEFPSASEALHAVDLGRGFWPGGSGCLRFVYRIYRAVGTPVRASGIRQQRIYSAWWCFKGHSGKDGNPCSVWLRCLRW